MVTIVDKALTTTDTDTLTGVVTDVTLLLTTNVSRVSCLSVDLKDFDPDNWVEFDDITDDNLIDWYCTRKNITREELETKLNTAYHTVEI